MARSKYFNREINDWVHADQAFCSSSGNASKYPDWSHLKWYVIGDSLTVPDTEHNTKRYYDFVQEKTGIQIEVNGVGGTGYGAGMGRNPPENFLTRVQNLFTEENKHILDDVDVVTIFGSGNDVRHLLTEQYSTELNGIPIWATLAEFANNKPGLRVIVVPPSPWTWKLEGETPEDIDLWKAKWKAYCDRLKECAVACNFRYLSDMYDCPPFNPNFTGHMEKYFSPSSDGIHPNEEGHKALAPYFYNALLQELAFKSEGNAGAGFTVTDDGAGNVTILSRAIADNNGNVVIA